MPAQQRTRRRTPAPVSESLQGLGGRLRQARAEAGLSQAQLGAPHFTRAYVSAIELGKVRPAMKSLEFMATKLNKPVAFFVLDDADEFRRKEREVELAAAGALLSRQTALEALARIEALLETATERNEFANLRLMAGTALNFLIRGSEAVKQLTQSERLATEIKDESLHRRVRYQLALAYRNVGDAARSKELMGALLVDLERLKPPDRLLQMKVLKDLGAIDMDAGRSESATAYYNAALVWANEIGDVSGLISIYNGLAYAYRAHGDLDAAMGYLRKALSATEISNDLVHATVIHNALAVVAAERGHITTAMQHADRAIALARAAGPRSYVASCLNTKAECAMKLGDVRMAEECATEGLRIGTETDNARAVAAAHLVLADIALSRGRPDQGEVQLGEAAAIYRTTGARSELGTALMRLSRLAHERGAELDAKRLAEQAYESTRQSSYLPER